MAPGAPVQLRVQLNGKDTALRNVSYSLQGAGTLSTTSGTTDSSGQATFVYHTPSPSNCDDEPVCGVVTASFTDADGPHTDALSVGVSSPVTVTVSPKSVSVPEGQSTGFTATVTGTSNQDVTWNATGGTIDQNGNYTAGTTAGVFSVTATSKVDSGAFDTATVTVTAPPTGITRTSNAAITHATCIADQRIDVDHAAPTGATSWTDAATCSRAGTVNGTAISASANGNVSFTESSVGGFLSEIDVSTLGSATGTGDPLGVYGLGGGQGEYTVTFSVAQPTQATIDPTVSSSGDGGQALLTLFCAGAFDLGQNSQGGVIVRNQIPAKTTLTLPKTSCTLTVQAGAEGNAVIGTGTGTAGVKLTFG
ncbi:MAG: Ig-like domain-containing protein [Gaiellaceae bacterium]